MLQVQNRIAVGWVLVIVWRRVNKGAAHLACGLRGENNHLHFAVGNVLEGVEVLVMSGDFNAAFPTSRTVEVQRARIVEYPPINRQMVVVEAFIHRSGCGAHPDAVLAFREGGAPATAQAQAHGDGLRIGRRDAEARVALGVDLRVLLAWLVQA